MSNWKNTSQNSGRGAPEQWYERRSYREPSYDAEMDDRWGNERVDTGPRSIPPLFPARSDVYNQMQFSSSNQVDDEYFIDDFQPQDDERSRSFSPEHSFRERNTFHPGRNISNVTQSGRVTRNPMANNVAVKRILRKGALQAIANIQSKPRFQQSSVKPKNRAQTQINIKTPVKNKSTKKPETIPIEFRIAILWENDAKAIINFEQATMLIKKLEQLLDEFPKGGHVPKFHSSALSGGIFKIACADQKSKDWITQTVANLSDLWEGAKFKVLQESELRKNALVTVVSPKIDDEIIVMLNRIEKQNPEVDTTLWRLHREFLEGTKRTIILSIDNVSLEYLKNHDWKLFFGLKKITFTKGVPAAPKVNKVVNA